MHRRNLTIFEQMLKKHQPKRAFNIQNRIFTEQISEECLRQTLNEFYLLDSQRISHYDEEHDRLFLIIFYKNPSGRILRKQWRYNDKILPNLQYFYKMKSANHEDLFYDEDCLKLGNISEKLKYLYPNDLSLICQFK